MTFHNIEGPSIVAGNDLPCADDMISLVTKTSLWKPSYPRYYPTLIPKPYLLRPIDLLSTPCAGAEQDVRDLVELTVRFLVLPDLFEGLGLCLYRDSGEENGSYYIIGVISGYMLALFRDNGNENGSYYSGFRV